MITDHPCVITGLQPWETEIGSNCKNIALELAAGRKVLYINYPDDIGTVAKMGPVKAIVRLWKALTGRVQVRQVQENLWVADLPAILLSINFIKNAFVFDLLNRFNIKLFASGIKKACRTAGIKDFWHFNDNDIFKGVYLKKYLKPLKSYYYSRDNLVAVPYWAFHGKRLEPILMAESDAVFANSTYLADAAKRHNPHSYYIGQGCETEWFDGRKNHIPHPLTAGLPSPVIGYTGVLFSLRLNIEWLEYLAKERPRYTLCLVGPEDDDFAKSVLHQLPNVVFPGKKLPEELPSIMAGFDVCINPQRVNEVTIGNYPRKIDEYLAMGKPTVALDTPAMKPFSAYVSLCTTKEEFVTAIDKSIENNTPEMQNERISYALQHTWKASVTEMIKHAERRG